MRFGREHLIHKALVALDEAAEASDPRPLAPTFALRFTLAFLFSCSDGDRDPFDAFWKAVQARGSGYARSTYARTCWERIARSVGAPSTIEFLASIRQAQMTPEDRARATMARRVRAAGLEQLAESQAKRDAQSCALDRPGRKR